MTVQQAIQILETHRDFKFLGRERRYNKIRDRKTIHYVFDQHVFTEAKWLKWTAENICFNKGL